MSPAEWEGEDLNDDEADVPRSFYGLLLAIVVSLIAWGLIVGVFLIATTGR